MVLRGTQIQRCGHGKCGLLSNRVLSCNIAELLLSGVHLDTWSYPCYRSASRRHFKQGGIELV